MEEKERLVRSLQIIDPLLQFLTKATGRTIISLNSLRSIIPKDKQTVIKDIPHLYKRGVLHVNVEGYDTKNDNHSLHDLFHLDDEHCNRNANGSINSSIKIGVGFPPCMNHFANGNENNGYNDTNDMNNDTIETNRIKRGLHGSTKAAGKRRLAALNKSFKQEKKHSMNNKLPTSERRSSDSVLVENVDEGNDRVQNQEDMQSITEPPTSSRGLDPHMLNGMIYHDSYAEYSVKHQMKRIKERHNDQEDPNKTIVKHDEIDTENGLTIEAKQALMSLQNLLDGNISTAKHDRTNTNSPNNSKDNLASSNDKSFILPKQAAYAGSMKERPLRNKFLSSDKAKVIPKELIDAMGLQLIEEQVTSIYDGNIPRRQLYLHQANAIESALDLTHTLVCTGTGSGKSLCFLLPILATVMNNDAKLSKTGNNDDTQSLEKNDGTAALIMFPTKALAQDQLSKLKSLLKRNPILRNHIRPGIIDGDTPHQNRQDIADTCNIILSNPDTLHAAILPGWKVNYQNLLAKLEYIVIDELHSYEGAFGAHVSLVLSRLYRLCRVANLTVNNEVRRKLVFLGCSATIGHPEDHFRLICPIAAQEKVTVITAKDDGSKCAAKHFFVWNPPLLDSSGNSINRVTVPPRNSINKFYDSALNGSKKRRKRHHSRQVEDIMQNNESVSDSINMTVPATGAVCGLIKRNHAADETARILAHLVKNRVRSIAFCKTRCLAEWVYERCISILSSTSETMTSMVDIYRGGYSASIRRGIEGRLFRNELFGVVGTCALELGVDIGGIDVTLHCGYPGSISSVLQQAGRAGRGSTSNGPSYSIMVCFSSPSEQHLWRHPKGLLGRGLQAPPAVPLNAGIVSGHMLCAAEEFPLCGLHSVTSILNSRATVEENFSLSDYDLFGSQETYIESLEGLQDRQSVVLQKVLKTTEIYTYSSHPSIKRPWSHVSLRSIEPINYSIVDLSHPKQIGTKVICEEAVLDTIPYSRVFYHAYPGAIIIHRGRRFKIHSMTSPPAFATANTGYRYNNCNLVAFAKPSNVQYTTNALSITLITVIKQLHRVELLPPTENDNDSFGKHFEPELSLGSLAGNGVVTVKRTVHGYKKLSLVNRLELSRSEITLPPMEYDTNGLWIDTEASLLAELMPDYDKGVHALSHAIVAVAPLFVPCNSSDLDCDHSHYSCSRVLLFDVRAGGAGTCSLLWKYFFKPDGVMKAAIDLLSCCSLECDGGHYQGGCPGCIQAVPCINFQQDLSRKAALLIAKRVLARIELTPIYKENCSSQNDTSQIISTVSPSSTITTPRRKLRQKKLERAGDLVSARKRNIVIGKPSWPTDNVSDRFFDGVDD